VTAANVLYELDDVQVQQNGVHYTPGSAETNSLFFGKHSSKKVLYAYLEAATTNELGYFALPFRNQQTVVLRQPLVLPSGLSQPSTFDDTDHLAIFSAGRNLTLVNLNTLTVLDSKRYYRNRQFGANLVYNHNNNRLSVFSTYFPIHGAYGLSVDEYDLSNNNLEGIDTTYNCLCDEEAGYNATTSPFYQIEFSEGTCAINYGVNPPRIWCASLVTDDGKAPQLFSFNANNLTDFTVCTPGAALESIAWDFTAGYAYPIFGNGDDGGLFSVSKVRLSDCSLVSTYNNALHTIDPHVFQLDAAEHHLYISIVNNTQTQIVSVNTNMLNSKVVTLNTNGL